MKKFEADVETLKEILEYIHNSESLDTHPWTGSHFVQEFVADHPNVQTSNPGEQLLLAIAELFRETMPGRPPKHGLRLDARWSQFGFLAARYFSPVLFGNPVPVSFQEAWEKIDQSILQFVYGKPQSELSNEEIAPYVLVGNEPEVTPISTMSDWHKKGLQRLLEAITVRENHLLQNTPDIQPDSKNKPRTTGRYVWLVLLILLIGLLVATGVKASRVYDSGMLVYEDVNRLQDNVEFNPGLEEIKTAGPLLESLQTDLKSFREEVDPYLWLGPRLSWIPGYGCELTYSQDLLDMAESLTDASVESYQAMQPATEKFESEATALSPAVITELLLQAQPQLAHARGTLEVAQAARDGIDVKCLSPYVHDNLVKKVDPILGLMDEALTIAVEFPRLVGATNEGPKTYLLLVQNQDELRSTGGFITAAGTLLLQDGRIIKLEFEDSGELDDWTRPYPVAPWQLREYMNSPVLIFRDSNWFPDFPTSALYAEYLYSYVKDHSVDGVIAFDQQMLVKLLAVLGPVELDGSPDPVDANNVISYMRAAKTPTEEERADPNWSNKKFISDISYALIAKLFAGNVQWEQLARVLIAAFDEHHMLLQLDNSAIAPLISKHDWDGAIRSGDSDFLMVLDTNIGFNKTNAVVKASLTYDIDLSNLDTPISNLTVAHQNNSDSKVPCLQWGGLTLEGQHNYPIDRCYWDYLRVYTVSGASLLESNPQSIPADWMIRREAVPAHVDVLEDEIDGVQGFGVLKVVPGGRSITTQFQFSLPATIIKDGADSTQKIYHLKIQKQPGTLAIPITIRVHLPNNAAIQGTPPGATVQEHNVLIQTDLRLDREFEIVFTTP